MLKKGIKLKSHFNTSKTTGTSKVFVQGAAKVRTHHAVRQLFSTLAVFGTLAIALSACTSKPAVDKGSLGYVQGFLGGVVADEPRAALVGRNILTRGGTAADAVTAMYFTMAVTLPSRAGLGGGGTCVAFDTKSGNTEVVDFNAPVPTLGPAQGVQAISVPANPRGFYALQARHGQLLWSEVVAPGEQLARFGFAASRALVQDLRATPDMRSLFVRQNATQHRSAPVREGDILKEPDLATTLGLFRMRGVGPFYAGPFARTLVNGINRAGGSQTSEDLRRFKPRLRQGMRVEVGNDVAYFPPAPAGAALAGTMFAMVQKGDRFTGQNDAGRARIMKQIARRAFAAQGIRRAFAARGIAQTTPSVQKARSSTAFAAVDRKGNAVSCAVSMNAPFGAKRVAQGTGVLLAAVPDARNNGALGLAPMLMVNENSKVFKFAAAASGGVTTPSALASVAARVLLAQENLTTALAAPRGPEEASSSSLVNALSCPGGLPGKPNECQIAVDPRGVGLATGTLH